MFLFLADNSLPEIDEDLTFQCWCGVSLSEVLGELAIDDLLFFIVLALDTTDDGFGCSCGECFWVDINQPSTPPVDVSKWLLFVWLRLVPASNGVIGRLLF